MSMLSRMSCLIVSVMIMLGQAALAAAPSPADGFNTSVAPHNLTIQEDGKILVFGNDLNRVNSDGSLDLSFNSQVLGGSSIALQPDGKLVIAGFLVYSGIKWMMRLDSDGSVDSSFDSSQMTGMFDVSVVLQSDGKILAAKKDKTTHESSMERFNANGSRDTTFTRLVFDATGTIKNIAVQPDGKILVGGHIDPILIRLNPDGSMDVTFHPPFNKDDTLAVDHLFLQPDGRILLERTVLENEAHVAARLNPDGTLDASFQPVLDPCKLIALQADGRILVFGGWVENGIAHEGITRLNQDGSIDASYRFELGGDFDPKAAGMQPDGKLVVSGSIQRSLDGGFAIEPLLNLFRLNHDGTLDRDFDFRLNPDHTITAMANQADGKTVIGGDFDVINGIPRNRVARLNADNSLDVSFNPGAGANGRVTGLGVQPDGKVVIIGNFTRVAGAARDGIARFNTDGALDASFNPKTDGTITRIVMRPSGKFLIQGSFTHVNGTSRNHIARLNADGTLDSSFNTAGTAMPNTSMDVQSDESVLIGGSDNAPFKASAKLIRVNASGAADTGFKPRFESGIRDVENVVVLHDGKILAVVDAVDHKKFYCWNSDGTTNSLYQSADYSVKGTIHAIAEQPEGKLVMGGAYSLAHNGTVENYLIFTRLNQDGTPDAGFTDSLMTNDYVRALFVRPDGKILIGGEFTSYDDVPCNHIALVNTDGSLSTETTTTSMMDGEVNALATGIDGNLVIGGKFSSVYQSPRGGAARMSAGGDLNSTFTANLRDVSAVAAFPDGRVVVCDRPTTGSETRVITRRNANGTTDSTFSKAIVDGPVNCMSVQPNGGLIVAGDFHRVKGQVRNQIARIQANGSLDQTFNAGDGVDLGEIVVPDDGDENNDWIYHQSRGRINSIAVQPDGKIVIVGMFDRVAGTDRKNIARLSSNGVHDVAFDPGVGTDDEVLAVAFQPDGKALIAGTFRKAGGAARNGIARLKSDGSLDTTLVPDSFDFDYFESIALQADGRILAAGYYHSNNGCGRIVRLNPDGSFDTMFETPDPSVFEFGGIHAIALQCDGKLLAGGLFETIGTTARRNLARISNPDAALQQLVISPGATGVTWKLGGSYPQPFQVLFENSNDGKNWNVLGWGSPIPGVGFRLGYLSLPIETSHYIRATGWSTGGQNNGSISVHQSTLWFVAPHYNAVTDWACYR